MYAAGPKKAVIDRDTDLLTKDEFAQHHAEVAAAIKEELQIWIDHKCFVRHPRAKAKNIIDVRWVGKWKKTKDPKDPSKTKRFIRMRMTLRGFKDRDADNLETFAGTSSRISQRLVVSEAAIRGWPLTAIDVKKAFLKGVTYRLIAQLMNEPVRIVCFDLDATAIAVIRTLPGFEDFDPAHETLLMLKPGTGCKDAPRAWSICLTDSTNNKFGAKPSLYDDQLIMRHHAVTGELEFLATKHVDDIKVAAPPHILEEFIATLHESFGEGELEITRDSFTNCGVRHLKTPTGYTLDQTEYLKALKPINIPNASAMTSDMPAPPDLASSFLSLLMALAYTLLTRVDLSVYVIALQRVAQAPLMIHIRRLNALVRFAQLHEVKLTYNKMECQSLIEIHSDAGFRKEEKDGIPIGKAMRGANFLRLGKRNSTYTDCHLLDWQCCQIKTVTRSTFASELAACIAATDSGIALAITLHEVQRGPLSARRAMEIRDHGTSLATYSDTPSTVSSVPATASSNSDQSNENQNGEPLCVAIDMCIDAMSIISAVSAEHIKPPAEKTLLCHLLWLQEITRNGLHARS